jgi:alpha-tubulin suppressor-like RCC1 family protein
VPGLTGVTQIASGGLHTCALVAGGQARCWGWNNEGALGDGSRVGGRTPVAVTGLSGITQISGGGMWDSTPQAWSWTCAVTAGRVLCWGGYSNPWVYNGHVTPQPAGPTGASQVAVGLTGQHFCSARAADGVVSCWGSNRFGQLGDGTTTDHSAPVIVPGLTGAIQVAGGSLHTCALRTSHQVLCWGDNSNGQLGDGTTTNRATPTPVTF